MTKRICAVVNTAALLHNLREVIKKANGKKVVAVIKADAYGHGALKAAEIYEEYAAMYAVATSDEALELCRGGTKKDILILAPVPREDMAVLIENDIILTVSDIEGAKTVSLEAEKTGKIARIHGAIDTGMSRIGFFPTDESVAELKEIASLPFVSLEAIFTHYAKADEKDKKWMNIQTERFTSFADALKKEMPHLNFHIANSAGIMEQDEQYGDFVRAGIVLYGLYPSNEVDKTALKLIPALSWKSRVSSLRWVERGEGISYGHTYVAEERIRVATVSCGYADGYPRLLSNRGRVLINGVSCKILGRVCMDQFMVDASNVDAKVDDEVILIGKSGTEEITADEIAGLTGTINYEVVCDIGKRVPRIYE
ncbi:MAG: alanine racemase [Clostridia bacterium]|nr:alanine racemase [Clostridia bacterium]